MAKWMMIIGAVLLLLGALAHVAPGLFGWFSRLPGDIRVESERGGLFIPVTSMIVISLLLTLLINLFRK